MGAKDARAGQKIHFLFCPFLFLAKEKGRFFEAGAADP
jgi:hypothetical protein